MNEKNFGLDGIFRCLPGLEIMYIFRWEEIGMEMCM